MKKFIENIVDWFVYFFFVFCVLIPCFPNDVWMPHISLTLVISFGLGMGNRILRELDEIKNKINKKDE